VLGRTGAASVGAGRAQQAAAQLRPAQGPTRRSGRAELLIYAACASEGAGTAAQIAENAAIVA